jgi:hypothetical protein
MSVGKDLASFTRVVSRSFVRRCSFTRARRMENVSREVWARSDASFAVVVDGARRCVARAEGAAERWMTMIPHSAGCPMINGFAY